MHDWGSRWEPLPYSPMQSLEERTSVRQIAMRFAYAQENREREYAECR